MLFQAAAEELQYAFFFLAPGGDSSSTLYRGHPTDRKISLFADEGVMGLGQNDDCLSAITKLLSKSQRPSDDFYQPSISPGGYVCAC